LQNLALTANGGQEIWDNQKYFLLLQTLNAIIYAIFVCFLWDETCLRKWKKSTKTFTGHPVACKP